MLKPFNKIFSASIQGLDCRLVEIETDLHPNLPSVMIVGLPDKSVEESKERVKSAIRAAGLSFPRCRVVVNLAPADLKKHGPLYDLPIAISILAAQGLLKKMDWDGKMFVGELSLTGEVRPINGALSVAKLARTLRAKELYLPYQNAAEAGLISGLKIKPVKSLNQLVRFLGEEEGLDDYIGCSNLNTAVIAEPDISEVLGQEAAKRAMLIAAAGGHNILMIGPPGTGKTMLAKSFGSLMPPLTEQQAIEVIEIYSSAGMLKDPLNISRPFRSPHHTASTVAMVGGGSPLRPGEITLAHNGVLHLDEITEFNRPVLEALREPLEEREITVTRAAARCKFPASFRLVATMNPCPCGFLGSRKLCRCSPARIKIYWSKISGPLLDRIDLFVWLESEDLLTLAAAKEHSAQKTSQALRDKVSETAKFQKTRGGELFKLDLAGQTILQQAVKKMNLSNRGCIRVLKVARTIADLDFSHNIKASHIGEALQYRLNLDLANIR